MCVLILLSFTFPPTPLLTSTDNRNHLNLNSPFLIPAYSKSQQQDDHTKNFANYIQSDSNKKTAGREYTACITDADETLDCDKHSKTKYDNRNSAVDNTFGTPTTVAASYNNLQNGYDKETQPEQYRLNKQLQEQGTMQTSLDMKYDRSSNSSPNSYANTLSSSGTEPQIVMESIEERPTASTAQTELSNSENKVVVSELKKDRGPRTDLMLQSPSLNSNNGDKPCVDLIESYQTTIKNVIRGWGCIFGTDSEDFIQAIPNPNSTNGDVDNIIFGKDKPDVIFSDVGIDEVYGGSGGDTIQGGPGNDQIFGKGGDDHLFGGSDDDLIVGGKGNNHMYGDTGNDVLKGGENSGANYFDCGEGLDVITDFNPKKGDITAGNCEIF